jgi:hypothetical protein
MLALGTGMIVLMVTTGVCLGLAGGWFGFRWRHKGRVFSETDREYFQNLLYRSESAEAAQRRIDGELASLAKRIGENTQALAASLNTTRDAGEPTFAATTF